MKKKILAVLVCVCLMAGLFTFAASAAAAEATIDLTITVKSEIKVAEGKDLETLSKTEIVSTFLDIKAGAMKATDAQVTKFISCFRIELESVSATKVNIRIVEDGTKNTQTTSDNPTAKFFTIGESVWDNPQQPFTLENVTVTRSKTLYSLSMGIRKHGDKGNVLVADEIGWVSYKILNDQGQSVTTGIVDNLYDLASGTIVQLEAHLKPEYAKYYKFSYWVDGNSQPNVQGEETKLNVTMNNNGSIFAVFTEIANRVTVTLDVGDNGKVVASSNNAYKIFNGDGVVSVFQGSSPTFVFFPDEGYEVAKVTVDGKEISNIKSLLTNIGSIFNGSNLDEILAEFKEFSNATNRDVYAYTYPKDQPQMNSKISVTFIKSKVIDPAPGATYAPGPDLSTSPATSGSGDGSTTLPSEAGNNNNAGDGGSGVLNPATGSAPSIAVFATLSVAAAAAFVLIKKKRG
ncbi:MAG: hypothetical protein FWF05_05420 [Oscillospiraceae bacterium]|nr:hypothetical protein [Oscillospiraceae bacterium]